MRIMIVAAVTVLLMPAGIAANQAGGTFRPICRNAAPQVIDARPPVARVHPLDREPNAKQMLAVLRTFDGCTRPAVIRENVGALDR